MKMQLFLILGLSERLGQYWYGIIQPAKLFYLMTLIAGLSILEGCMPAQERSTPNIILIMSDDMGYSDIACYGGEIKTPNLDKLASEGLRFTQFYNTGRCCPTRASLLTGLYPHQTGIGHMVDSWSPRYGEGYTGDLNRKSVTIAEVLKQKGYLNYIAGKWHIASDFAPDGPKHNWPLQRGFDRFYGTIFGANSFWDPFTLTRGNTMISPYNDPEYRPEKYYYTDAISDNAVKFIDEHESTNPFFMFVSYTAAHWPMHAFEEDISKVKGRYDSGWDAIREERLKKMKELGLVDDAWVMTPPDNIGWENEKNKQWMLARMEVYAAMTENMDRGIGRIISKLKDVGKLDNTIIFFLQDNGGCAEEYSSVGPVTKVVTPDEAYVMADDELQTEMRPRFTRQGKPMTIGEGVMPGPPGTYVAYGQEWANVSNTPFREYKHWVHEGGISTPLIVHWPENIEAKGEFRHQPGHIIDIMATCVDIANADYPKEYMGNKITPMEGLSLAPAFKNHPLNREAIYWEHEMNRAIRKGQWKLVSKGNMEKHQWGEWELYDMETDRTEMFNLANKYSEIVEELSGMWDEYAYRTKVYPSPWEEK